MNFSSNFSLKGYRKTSSKLDKSSQICEKSISHNYLSCPGTVVNKTFWKSST